MKASPVNLRLGSSCPDAISSITDSAPCPARSGRVALPEVRGSVETSPELAGGTGQVAGAHPTRARSEERGLCVSKSLSAPTQRDQLSKQ